MSFFYLRTDIKQVTSNMKGYSNKDVTFNIIASPQYLHNMIPLNESQLLIKSLRNRERNIRCL